MTSSDKTMWGFEKVGFPLTTEPILPIDSWPKPTPSDDNRSPPIERDQDPTNEREDNKSSSSTVSGRPVLDQRLAKSFKIVHRRREKLVERRVKVVHQRREHEYQRKSVQASNQRAFDATEVFLKRFGVEAYSSPEYLAIVRALKESTDRARILESMETKLQESTEIMNLKEAELVSKEKKVYKRLATLTGLTIHPHIREQPQPTHSASSNSTTHTHPRARKYYDRAGQVKILRDRVHNMQVQHQQDLLSRQARRESGHITKLPERLFHERFYGRLASTLEELERANKDAFLLKLACERQGIALEDEAETHHDQHDYDSPVLENDRVILPNLGGDPISRNGSFLLDELLAGYNDTTTKIRRWLNGIPQNTKDMDDTQSLDVNHLVDSDITIAVALDSASFGPTSTDVPAPVEKHMIAGLDAQRSRMSLTPEDPDAGAMKTASDLSGGPTTSSDREFSQEDFAGDAPRRRYSEPSPELIYWLRPNGAQKVLNFSQGNDGRRLRRHSH